MWGTHEIRKLELKRFCEVKEKVVLKFEFDDSLNLEQLQKYYISDFILYFRKFQNLSSVIFDLSVKRLSFYLNVQKSIGIKDILYFNLESSEVKGTAIAEDQSSGSRTLSDSTQLPTIPIPGDPVPSSGLQEYRGVQTYTHAYTTIYNKYCAKLWDWGWQCFNLIEYNRTLLCFHNLI